MLGCRVLVVAKVGAVMAKLYIKKLDMNQLDRNRLGVALKMNGTAQTLALKKASLPAWLNAGFGMFLGICLFFGFINTSAALEAPIKEAVKAIDGSEIASISQTKNTTETKEDTPLPAPADNTSKKTFANLFGASKPKQKFLPVHQAFQVSASQEERQIVVRFQITPKHYIYQDKLQLILPNDLKNSIKSGAWKFNQNPTTVDDPAFGRVLVFEKDVVATLTLDNMGHAVNTEIAVAWQGCAVAGLCYPPERTKLHLKLDKSSQNSNQAPSQHQSQNSKENKELPTSKEALPANINAGNDPAHPDASKQNHPNQFDTNYPLVSNQATLGVLTPNGANDSQAVLKMDGTDMGSYALNHQVSVQGVDGASSDARFKFGFGLDKNPLLAIGLLFLAGIGLAFTACVYPMIPIVANIVAKSERPSAWRGFCLTLAYALGVATSYGVLGAVIAWFGRSLGIIGYLQNPKILLGFAVVFVLLGLYMLGVIKLSLPSAIANRLGSASRMADRYLGSVFGSFLVGALSALVVSPCVSAPLAGALLSVSMIGKVWLGFVALFALGFGLCLPLVVMGAAQGRLMPKAGAWMADVKFFAGWMLLFVALLLINRVYLNEWLLLLWAFWFAVSALFFWRIGRIFFGALGLILALWAGLLLVGFALKETDAWQPLRLLSKPSQSPQAQTMRLYDLKALDKVLMTEPKVLVELTADWCIECRIMEKTLFERPPQALSDWKIVKLDITQTSDDSRAILARYQLFGPPALLYYQQGQLALTQLGEVGSDDFEQALLSMP